MARRLSTDAKIVLDRAGYRLSYTDDKPEALLVRTPMLLPVATLAIDGGTVDNGEVVRLLEAVGYDEHGHRK